jgi:hypothetical protein
MRGPCLPPARAVVVALLGRGSGREDRVPGSDVVGVDPALDHSSVPVSEDADESSLYVRPVTTDADRADRADMVVAGEDVVLDEPGADPYELREPSEDGVEPVNRPRHVVSAGNVPYDLRRDEGPDQVEVA